MTDATIRPEPTHPRWLIPAVGAAIVALIAANNIGNVLWATWLDANPLGLIALNSSNKYLLGTSVSTDLLPFVAIGVVRLMLPDPLFWFLGHTYGQRALTWAQHAFPGVEPLVRQFRGDATAFQKVLPVLVVVMPNNPVCLLAGVARMPFVRFMALSLGGTIGRVLLIRWVGSLFEEQIEDLLDVVARYQTWLTRGSIAVVIGLLVWQFVTRRGLVGAVETLDDDLGEDEA